MISKMAFLLVLDQTPMSSTDITKSQRSDSPRCEAHLDLQLHFERPWNIIVVKEAASRAVLADAPTLVLTVNKVL